MTTVRSDRELAVLILGLCPAAAACTRLIDALWISAGVFFVLAAVAGVVSVLRPRDGAAQDWGVLLVSSCCAGVFDVVLGVLAPAAAARLGVVVPLVAVTAPAMAGVLGSPQTLGVRAALLDAGQRILMFAAVLVVVTAAREVLGSGTLTLGGTIAVQPFFQDPARALSLSGGALICLGYVAALARVRRGGGKLPGREEARG